jgi:serine/threonine protein kinase
MDGRYKLLDFGIVRLAGAATITDSGIVLGSLPYLAPERIKGERGDMRSDLFGLGMVYYAALSGRHPYHGKTDAEMLSAIMLSPAAPLEGLPGTLGPLADLTLNLLEKEPSQRPATATDVLQRVRRMRSTR